MADDLPAYVRGGTLRAQLAALGLRGPARRVSPHRARNACWILADGRSRTVVRRYAWGVSRASVEWELEVMRRVGELGWPVPVPLASDVDSAGAVWVAFSYVPGRLRPRGRSARFARDEQRHRGRLLAEFHQATADLRLDQRPGWTTRAAAVMAIDLDKILRAHERRIRVGVARLRTELEATRARLAELDADARPIRLVHGDFARWNLRWHRGRLSGLLDWEFCHLDDLVADFVWSWRGLYTDVLTGYQQVRPLEEIELALLEPVWRAWVLDVAVDTIRTTAYGQQPDLEWVVGMLDRRPEPF